MHEPTDRPTALSIVASHAFLVLIVESAVATGPLPAPDAPSAGPLIGAVASPLSPGRTASCRITYIHTRSYIEAA